MPKRTRKNTRKSTRKSHRGGVFGLCFGRSCTTVNAINSVNSNRLTDLYVAVMNNNLTKVKELLSAGTDVNKEINNKTPLYIACAKGHDKIVEQLIAAGADINKMLEYMFTPLYCASYYGHVNIVEKLIVAGADVNRTSIKGYTPLFAAVSNGNEEVVIKLLSAPRIDVNVEKMHGDTPFQIACEKGYLDIVKHLIAAGADINKGNHFRETPLYLACKNNQVEIVKLLLKQPTIDKTRAIQDAYKFSEEITTLLIGEREEEEEKEELWQGWTRSDIDRLNEIFEDTTAPNITLCPVCLKTTTRDKGCMHMKHNCKDLPGFYHKQLYSMYNENGKIHWCTICGRIGYSKYGVDFYHYKLGLAKDGRPGTHGPTYVFDESCATRSDGGGLDEKFKRFQKIREKAFNLNTPEYINKITEKQAKEMLVEAMWNAPIESTSNINAIKATKSWNIPNTAFPVNVVKENAPNVPTPPTHLEPIVHPEETEEFQNATMISDNDIIQFRHEGNMHDKEGQQISRDGFVTWIQSIGINPTNEGYLKCWAYDLTGVNHCGIKLYPKEVRIALGLAEMPEEGENAEYRKLYEIYRKKFNEANQVGGK